MKKQKMKKKRKLNLLRRDNYRCGIHLGGCGKKITLEETSVDHIIPKNIFKRYAKEYMRIEESYKAETKKPLGNELFNLQPMCFSCNNAIKGGVFPPQDIIKMCSNKCCKFIYIEEKNKSKYYLVFTHNLLKKDENSLDQGKPPLQVSIILKFSLINIQYQFKDGTITPKSYKLFGETKNKLFGEVKKFFAFIPSKVGGKVSDLDITRNNQKYSREEFLESVKDLNFVNGLNNKN